MIPQLRRIRSSDNNIRQLQDATDAVFKVIIDKAILDGNLLQDIPLDSAILNSVDHKLGRSPRGYIVVRSNANSNVWDSQDVNPMPTKTLNLNCDVNVTISLWVF